MAVLSVNETFADERVDENPSRRAFYRTFLVQTDSVLTRREDILDHADIPAMGDAYTASAQNAYVVERQAFRKQGSNTAWEVWIVYSTESLGGGVTDPLSRRPVVRTISVPYTVVPEIEEWHPIDRLPADTRTAVQDLREVDGAVERLPILNTAQCRFDPSIERDDEYPGLEVIRNEPAYGGGRASFSWANVAYWNNSVNVDDFVLMDAAVARYQARLFVTAELARESGVSFWRVAYRILINPDTWIRFILNQGYRFVSATHRTTDRPMEWAEFADAAGQPVSEPELLDWNGLPLKRSVRNGQEPRPIYLPFHIYKLRAHAALGLPRSILDVIILPGDSV